LILHDHACEQDINNLSKWLKDIENTKIVNDPVVNNAVPTKSLEEPIKVKKKETKVKSRIEKDKIEAPKKATIGFKAKKKTINISRGL
jgi:hypothetical protein